MLSVASSQEKVNYFRVIKVLQHPVRVYFATMIFLLYIIPYIFSVCIVVVCVFYDKPYPRVYLPPARLLL